MSERLARAMQDMRRLRDGPDGRTTKSDRLRLPPFRDYDTDVASTDPAATSRLVSGRFFFFPGTKPLKIAYEPGPG